MINHKCVIGIAYDADDSPLVDLEELKIYIQQQNDYREFVNEHGGKPQLPFLRLKDFIDGRRNLGFTKFYYCPFCGKAIDWKKIKEEADNGRN